MTYEEWLRQNVGQPVQNAAAAAAAPIDAATDARIRAAQQIAAQQQPQSAINPMAPPQLAPDRSALTGATPGMGGSDASVPLSFDAMARRNARLNATEPKEQEIDPSQYRDVPSHFAGLAKKIQAQKPINKKDINKAIDVRDQMAGSGMQEFTPELAKKLGYEEEE